MLVAVLLFPAPATGQDEESDSLEDELDELKEDDYPDLVGRDETGELMDEFALLEEELGADEVESASKHRQSIFWSPSAITVFTRDQILSSGANRLPDLLRRVPGFDIYEMKPSFLLVGARALTETSNNLVLVLVDGREAMIEMSGFAVWAGLTIDLKEVERVEVIRGPGSTLYGANAFAAVISITTVSDRTGGGGVFLTGGEEGYQRLFGRVRNTISLGDGNLSFSASLGSDGQRSHSNRLNEITKVYFRSHGYLRYRLGQKLDLSLHAGGALGDGTLSMTVGDFHATNVLNHYEMGQAEVGLTEKAKLKVQLYHSRYLGEFHAHVRLQAFDVWMGDIPDFYLDTNSVDGQVQLDLQAADDLLFIGGGNLRYTTLESDRLIPNKTSELRGAGFLHAQWNPWDVIQLTGGLRFDWNSETEEALSPRAVVVYRPWPDHAFRLGYGLAFRKPSGLESRMHLEITDYNKAFPEIVEKLKTAIGNENLVNEKVHSFEAGWRAYFLEEQLQASVDLFYNIYQDMIYFKVEMERDSLGSPDVLESFFQFINEPARMHAIGGEAEVVGKPSEAWTLWGNLGLRRVTDHDGTRLRSEPRLRANLGCRWDPGRGPLADLAWHYVSSYEMPLVLPENPLEEPQYMPLGNTHLLVGRLGYRLPVGPRRMLEAGLSVRTPVGHSFREYAGIPMPRSMQGLSTSDYGGEILIRLVAVYLRGSF